eukprot:Nk52_evm59s1992 gene=Nk52_evmTU59s1992
MGREKKGHGAAPYAESEDSNGILKGLVLCIPSYGMGQVRHKILSSQARDKGAVVVNVYQGDVTHVVLDARLNPKNKAAIATLKRNAKIKSSSAEGLEVKNERNMNVIFVHADWLSQINIHNELVPEAPYVLDLMLKKEERAEAGNSPKRQKVDSESAGRKDEAKEGNGIGGEPNTFACMKSSRLKEGASDSSEGCINQFIIDKLKVLLEEYTAVGDKWRVMGYKKAIAALSGCKEVIRSTEQAHKLPHVGQRLAEKIGEIAATRHLRRLDYVDERVEVLKAFCDIHGVGPAVAADLYAKGFRSIEQLREYSDSSQSYGNSPKVTLSKQQRIGLKHVEDFRQRIPREEVTCIGNCVREVCHKYINEELIVEVCGSYRRGKQTCGDIDVLITHPDGKSHEGVFRRVIQLLKSHDRCGNIENSRLHGDKKPFLLLTDDLSYACDRTQQKYLGVCRLFSEVKDGLCRESEHLYRRIDIIVCPRSEWACALFYFTGNDYFNRSVRLLAKKKGMHLSQHSLIRNYVGGTEEGSLKSGEIVPTLSERDIFKALEIPYLRAEERNS